GFQDTSQVPPQHLSSCTGAGGAGVTTTTQFCKCSWLDCVGCVSDRVSWVIICLLGASWTCRLLGFVQIFTKLATAFSVSGDSPVMQKPGRCVCLPVNSRTY